MSFVCPHKIVLFAVFAIFFFVLLTSNTNAQAPYKQAVDEDIFICPGKYQAIEPRANVYTCQADQQTPPTKDDCFPQDKSPYPPSPDFTASGDPRSGGDCWYPEPRRFREVGVFSDTLGPTPAGLKQLQELFKRFLNLSVGIAFIALTIMIVVASIRYITSGGEAKQTQAAAGTITWAILGIVFLVLAWLVLRLIEAFTGVEVTKFCIGFSC